MTVDKEEDPFKDLGPTIVGNIVDYSNSTYEEKDPFKNLGPTIVGNIVDYSSSNNEEREDEQKKKVGEESRKEDIIVVEDKS